MLCRYLQYFVWLELSFFRDYFSVVVWHTLPQGHRLHRDLDNKFLGKTTTFDPYPPGSQSQGLCTCYIKSLASCQGRLVLKDTGCMSHNYFGFWFDTYYRGWSIKHLVGLQSLLSYTTSSKALPGSPCTTSVAVLDTEHHTPTKKKLYHPLGFGNSWSCWIFPNWNSQAWIGIFAYSFATVASQCSEIYSEPSFLSQERCKISWTLLSTAFRCWGNWHSRVHFCKCQSRWNVEVCVIFFASMPCGWFQVCHEKYLYAYLPDMVIIWLLL